MHRCSCKYFSLKLGRESKLNALWAYMHNDSLFLLVTPMLEQKTHSTFANDCQVGSNCQLFGKLKHNILSATGQNQMLHKYLVIDGLKSNIIFIDILHRSNAKPFYSLRLPFLPSPSLNMTCCLGLLSSKILILTPFIDIFSTKGISITRDSDQPHFPPLHHITYCLKTELLIFADKYSKNIHRTQQILWIKENISKYQNVKVMCRYSVIII